MTPAARDDWWKRQFSRLLAEEIKGRAPATLENKWLLLASRTRPTSRWQVTFDVPDNIYHLLDDADVRTKSAVYASTQWAAAREWLHG
ncbi:MAG: hypothetical protein PGN12_08430 [Sphingomonas phyllosphaerae]